MVPQVDLQAEIALLRTEIMAAVEAVLQTGQFILGPQVEAFEKEAAAYLGVKYTVGVNSGTDALVIALQCVDIGPGDEVITTPFTFFATAEAISRVGATPVFIDINPHTFNLVPELVAGAVTVRTKAILPVHLYGQAAELGSLLKIAAQNGLKVIEDTAQAFGGEYKGKKLGTIGDVGCYSFFPTKRLGGLGDGGLIATNSAEIAEKAHLLRVHGSKQKYYHEALGYNSRLDEMQAAVLRVKLPHLEEWINLVRRAAHLYTERLADLAGTRLIVTPWESPDGKHVYHQYTLRIRQGKREQLQQYLAGEGIQTTVYYPHPLHQLPLYCSGAKPLPEAELATQEVLSLPIWPLISEETVQTVVKALHRWAELGG